MAPGVRKRINFGAEKAGCGIEKKSGQSAAEIAKMLDRSVKWVNRWWAKDKQPGPTSFVNKKGRGRKTKLTFAEQIQASIRSTTIGSNESAKCLNQMGTTTFR